VFKNATFCPLTNITTHRGTTGKSLKTFKFITYQQNVLIEDFQTGGGRIVGLVGEYGGKVEKVDVKVIFECKDIGGWEDDVGEDVGEDVGVGDDVTHRSKAEFKLMGERDGVLYGTMELPFECGLLDLPDGWRERGVKEVERREGIRRRIKEEVERVKKGEEEKKIKKKGGCPKCEKCKECKKCNGK
jgi:hypothetical protein